MSNYFIDKYEENRLVAYKCPSGVWTISQGITFYPNGQPIKEGDEISKEFSEVLVNDYLIKNVHPVIKRLNKNLSRRQKEALESLIFNIGAPAFEKSKLRKAILENNSEQIFKNWDWIKGNGKVLNGLVKRRAEELSWYLSDI